MTIRKKPHKLKNNNSSVNSLYANNPTQTHIDSNSHQNNFEKIMGYYTSLSSNGHPLMLDYAMPHTFVVTLAKIIINNLNSIKESCKNGFPDSFYDLCVTQLYSESAFDKSIDNEMCIIYLKQCKSLLLHGQVFTVSKGKIIINDNEISDSDLYLKLYYSFWDKVPWEDIFPSDENAAKELQYNKNILIDLLVKSENSIEVDRIANDFIELTGISYKNDLFMISFIDFYFFTWMKHFGILSYSDKNEPLVTIHLTENGKKLLRLFQ